MKKISKRALTLTGQPMFHILSRAKQLEADGKDVLHFELGDPNFDTPQQVKDEAYRSLLDNNTHYCESRGLKEFRQVAADLTEKRSRGFRPNPDKQILVTNGANSQLGYVINCVTDADVGDEVITTNPCFPTYTSQRNFSGVKSVFVDLKEENEFRLNPKDLEDKITDKTRLIIINSPNNPTGSVLTQKETKEIYEIAKKHDVYLLSDEIYARMIYPDSETKFSSPSIYDQCKERVIVANGFSKSYSMTGWRIGSLMGPEDLVEKMALALETNCSCVSPFIQKAAIKALTMDQTPINEMMHEYRRRRDLIYDGLNSLKGVSAVKPKGAFYIFPNISGTGMKDKEFVDLMLEKANVALCPGSFFGHNLENYVRFSYASSERKDIEVAIDRMSEILK